MSSNPTKMSRLGKRMVVMLMALVGWGVTGPGRLVGDEAVGASKRGAGIGEKAAVVHRDLVYAKPGPEGRPLKQDLYLPGRPDAGARRWPVVVWIHGGGWRAGDKRPCPMVMLVRAGYAVASVEYRLSGEATWPAPWQDCRAAIRWLRAHAATYALDERRFAAAGASAGGHLVAMLGTAADVEGIDRPDAPYADRSAEVEAVIDFFGPTDLAGLPVPRKDRRNAVARLLGGSLAEKADLAEQASPLHHVSPGDAPFLIIHGDKDRLVPVEQSRRLHAALRKAGVESTLLIVPGAGHGLGLLKNQPDLPRRIRDFLDVHLHVKSTTDREQQ